jgi:hypothetical protein
VEPVDNEQMTYADAKKILDRKLGSLAASETANAYAVEHHLDIQAAVIELARTLRRPA